MTKFRFEMNSYDEHVSSVEESLPDLPEAKMNEELNKIAEEAVHQLRHDKTDIALTVNTNIIQAAIEKARGIKTTEYAKGWDDHVAAIRAAHASDSHVLPHDWNKDLPVITHLTPPARASEDE